MTHAVVNCASDTWVRGQNRLYKKLHEMGEPCMLWTNQLPQGSPPHRALGHFGGRLADAVPYAFKAYALKEAALKYNLLLWADACILPIRDMAPLWGRIERDGYWFSDNGYTNYEWTADSAYPDLFPIDGMPVASLHTGRSANKFIPHVVATAFGINVKHPLGRAFLDEYYRLASTTKAFCGPWSNANCRGALSGSPERVAPCGPPDVWGHRHDQTAASVIAWRLGMELTLWPDVFAYRGGENEKTILVADGTY
jgi:hypothetical protein